MSLIFTIAVIVSLLLTSKRKVPAVRHFNFHSFSGLSGHMDEAVTSIELTDVKI